MKLYGSYNKKGGIKMAVVAMKQLLEAGVHFGHIEQKTVIPIGVMAKIDTSENTKIKLLENCVK